MVVYYEAIHQASFFSQVGYIQSPLLTSKIWMLVFAFWKYSMTFGWLSFRMVIYSTSLLENTHLYSLDVKLWSITESISSSLASCSSFRSFPISIDSFLCDLGTMRLCPNIWTCDEKDFMHTSHTTSFNFCPILGKKASHGDTDSRL